MKSFLYFIVGAALGATGAVFVTKYICDAKAEKKIADATVEARDFYKDKYEQKSSKLDDIVNETANRILTSAYAPNLSEDSVVTDRIFGNTFNAREAVDYRSIETDPNKNKPYIYMIDPDEAGMDDAFTQYSLDYYQDGSLVDEQGNLIDNPLEIVGDFVDDLSMENPNIYVRNDVTKTEYDVCYIPASYEQPGGIGD